MVARVICYFLGHMIALESAKRGGIVPCARCKTRMFVLPPELDHDTLDDCPHPNHKDPMGRSDRS